MTNLDTTRQNQRKNLGGISLRLEQARRDDIGIGQDFHFRPRAICGGDGSGSGAGVLERDKSPEKPNNENKQRGDFPREF